MPLIFRMQKFSLAAIAVIVLLAALVPRMVISIYTNNPELVEATIPSYYIILGALVIFSGMSVLFNGVLGTANTKISLGIEAITLMAYLGFTWLAAVHLKLSIEVVWVAEYIYFFLIGLLSLWYLLKGNWRAKTI
jgi:Na+-driven multidrug efflux pump